MQDIEGMAASSLKAIDHVSAVGVFCGSKPFSLGIAVSYITPVKYSSTVHYIENAQNNMVAPFSG